MNGVRGRGPTVCIAAGALLAGLAGCSGGSSPSAGGTTTPAGARTSASAGPSAAAPTATSTATGVVRGVQLTSCSTTAGAVKAAGTFTLPSGVKGSTAQVWVYWSDSKTGSVYASGEAKLTGLTTDKKADWSVSATLPTTSGVTIRCSLRAVSP